MSESHVLRNVVATLLAAGALAAGEASAGSFCSLNGCQVRPPALVPGFFGGGGGGGWGNDGNSGDPEREHRSMWCMDFPHEVGQYGCNVYAPPPLAVNGCGTAGGAPVPDFLVSPVLPGVAAGLGGIFTRACDLHDACYGQAGANKTQCDDALYRNMVEFGQMNIPPPLRPTLMTFVGGQAWAYSKYLRWDTVSPWNSGKSFNVAQDEAYCRRWAAEHQQICR